MASEVARTAVYWIPREGPGRMAVVLRPRREALSADICALRDGGLDVLVSLLQEHEERELGLAEEQIFAEAAGLTFLRCPCADGGVPAWPESKPILDAVRAALSRGQAVGMHCRMSMGRAPTLAATLLKLEGIDPDDAWHTISLARGYGVPDSPAQVWWVANLEPW